MAFDPAIGHVFNFTAQELEANNRGELSADQQAMYAATSRVSARRASRVSVVVPVFLAVVAAAVMAAVVAGGDGSATPVIVAAVILLWVGGLTVWGVRRGNRSSRAISAARLSTTEGPFDWTTTVGAFWVGTIGDARFGVDRLATEVLQVGAPYRLHYLPLREGAWVMSLERIDG